MSDSPSARLAALGLSLPPVVPPVGSYVPAKRSGSLVFTSGQLPMEDGQLRRTGLVGGWPVSTSDARDCAQLCALNGLAAIDALVGLDSVASVIKVVGFVACAPSFNKQPVVVDGASELLGQLFDGGHARSAVGVASLPLGAPVEVELIVELG